MEELKSVYSLVSTGAPNDSLLPWLFKLFYAIEDGFKVCYSIVSGALDWLAIDVEQFFDLNCISAINRSLI